MNIASYGLLVDSHVAELHRDRERSSRARTNTAASVRSAGSARGVRRLLGVALVEAGLHLLASPRSSLPASFGNPT
jgi:hypothetical protein